MAQPVWETPAGNLGTIAEGLFYQVPIEASDPEGGTLTYTLLAGELPAGIQLNRNGLIEGVPSPTATAQGVPTQVGEDVTSQFAVRASNTAGSLSDRTFSITVTGQDIPLFTTPAGSLGTYYTGDVFGPNRIVLKIEFTDDDPNDTLTVSIDDGELPPGLAINQDGTITGYIGVTPSLPESADPGFDVSAFAEYPFDFPARQLNRSYQFTVAISDGKNKNTRTFRIDVIARTSLSADTMQITADSESITADEEAIPVPVIANYPSNGFIGTYRHDNFFAYQIKGFDFDNQPFEFEIIEGDSSDLPPSLIFDPQTGWLRGYLNDLGATETTYQFDIIIRQAADQSVQSDPYPYSITVIGDIEVEVNWLSGTLVSGTTDVYNLGSIKNGDISTLKVEATTTLARTLLYRLSSGTQSQLPQGLQLLPSGNIAGRASFNTFCLDSGTTTFDSELQTRLDIAPTTFDMTFDFTVQLYTLDLSVNTTRRFRITLNREYNSPYQSIYIETQPPQQDRDLINSLLQNSDIFVENQLYRPDDAYFGVATSIQYVHAYSLRTADLYTYFLALQENHYRKKLVLGEIKTAQALDNNSNVLYEVVYAEIVDSGVNKQGLSPPEAVEVPYPFESNDGSTEVDYVYPNSLPNMRNRVIEYVGEDNIVLPLWMTSRQSNGSVLGYTPAAVLCYTNPGFSSRVQYQIKEQFGTQLNKIDFTVDRYILDGEMTGNWVVNEDSTDGGNWNPHPALSTTFDWDGKSVAPDSTIVENATVFDGNATKFAKPADVYPRTDANSKYLVFPKINILE